LIINLNETENNQIRSYDVCICGAGVAGITIAIELAKSGKKVALFEGGGEEYTEASQALYQGEITGLEYGGLNVCRLRYLGGTSNHWSGRNMLLQSIDFEDRDFFPLPGWPIKKVELDKYKKSAFDILELNENSLDAPEIKQLSSSSMKSIGHGSTPPVRFATKYKHEFLKSKKIDLYINANLTDIKLNDSSNHVRQLNIKNFNNNSYEFSGDTVILAMGAVENARLLLNSNSQLPNGIGNHSNFVGRCFMEHFQLILGSYTINPDNPVWKNEFNLEFFPTSKFVMDKKIGTSVIHFGKASSESYGKLKAIKKALRNGVCSFENLGDIYRRMFDDNCPGDGIITTICEQSPNIDSRITLSNEKDSLGLRRVSLNWKTDELDERTIRTLAKETAKEFARLDFGRVKLEDYILSNKIGIDFNHGHCHQMGTTRMSKLPENGVVDKNCKVFGIDNLFIAGSSIFSTSGGVNPTLSIVQLSLRLAEHIVGNK